MSKYKKHWTYYSVLISSKSILYFSWILVLPFEQNSCRKKQSYARPLVPEALVLRVKSLRLGSIPAASQCFTPLKKKCFTPLMHKAVGTMEPDVIGWVQVQSNSRNVE